MVLRSMVPSVPNESFSSKIIDSLLAAKETGEQLHLEFVKNRVPYHNTSFFETIIKWYNLQRGEKEDTKGNFSADGGSSSSRIVFSKFTDKKDEFHYPLTSYPLELQIQVEKYINQQRNTYSEMSLSRYHVIRLKKST